MKATPIYPIESMHGNLTPGYYCRMLNGRLIIQRKPCRRGHVPTPCEAANQRLFAAQYRVKKGPVTGNVQVALSGRPLGDHFIPAPHHV